MFELRWRLGRVGHGARGFRGDPATKALSEQEAIAWATDLIAKRFDVNPSG